VALNADGTVRWRHRIADEWVDSSPCIDENGVIYIGSSSAEPEEPYDFYGVLYAFGHGEEVNEPPNTPSIQGQTSGKPGETYTYTIQATDYDNDMISYFVDWDVAGRDHILQEPVLSYRIRGRKKILTLLKQKLWILRDLRVLGQRYR